jgi:hypothetical protein
MKKLILLFVSPVLAAQVAGCSPVNGYCAAAGECDSNGNLLVFDPVGDDDDSVNVCIAQTEGQLRALRANEEEECHKLADALEVYYACVARVFAEDADDACDGFELLNNDNPCDDELDDVNDAQNDVDGDECSSGEE